MKSIKAAGLNELHIVHDLAHAIWPSAYGDILSSEQLKYMLDKIYSIAFTSKPVRCMTSRFYSCS